MKQNYLQSQGLVEFAFKQQVSPIPQSLKKKKEKKNNFNEKVFFPHFSHWAFETFPMAHQVSPGWAGFKKRQLALSFSLHLALFNLLLFLALSLQVSSSAYTPKMLNTCSKCPTVPEPSPDCTLMFPQCSCDVLLKCPQLCPPVHSAFPQCYPVTFPSALF